MAPFDDRVVVEGIGAAVYGTLGGFRARLLALLGREDEARELEIGRERPPPRVWDSSQHPGRSTSRPTGATRTSIDDDRVAVASREADLWTSHLRWAHGPGPRQQGNP